MDSNNQILKSIKLGNIEIRKCIYFNNYVIQLLINDKCWMSTLSKEIETQQEFLNNAKGDILIGGLGLGVVLFPLLKNQLVTSITVIENNIYVLSLISKLFKNKHIKFIHKNIYDYIPEKKFDTIWIDIFRLYPNEEEITSLNLLYRPYLKDNGWFGLWTPNKPIILWNKH